MSGVPLVISISLFACAYLKVRIFVNSVTGQLYMIGVGNFARIGAKYGRSGHRSGRFQGEGVVFINF